MFSLLSDRNFAKFFTARSISLAGSSVSAVVLPIYIYQRTGSPALVSLITSVTILPYLAFGALAGALSDRLNRGKLLVICDIISALAMAAIPITVGLHVSGLWIVYVAASFSAAAAVWFDAGCFGAVFTLVGRANITNANSLLWSSSNAFSVIAPAIAGLAASGIGASNTVALDAASFAVSAILLSRVAARLNNLKTSSSAASAGVSVREVLQDVRNGFSYLWRHPLIRTLTLIGVTNAITGGAVLGLMVVYATRGLHVADHGLTIGLLYAADAAGAALGGLVLPRLTKRLRPTRLTVISLSTVALLVIAMALTTQYLLGLILILCWSLADTVIIVNGVSIRQTIVPDDLQGRVNTTARMLAFAGIPTGSTLGGVLAEYHSIGITLLLCSAPAVVGVIAALIVRLPRYTVVPEESPADDDIMENSIK
jgi:MFS family permease